jgi:integrase
MTERSPGSWRLRVYIGDDPATGRPRQATRTFKGTERHAQTALADFVTEVTSGRAPVASSTTLSVFLDQWINYITPTRSPTTVRGYRDKARRIACKLGRIQLANLNAHTLDRAYREWLGEGLSPTTVHHLHGVISAALNQAVRWGIVPSAATQRTSPPPLRIKPAKIPAPEAIQRLISAAEDKGQPVLAAAIAVAATTGVRRGELVGLRWDDIDLKSGTLHVRRAVKHDDGPGWVVGLPKAHQKRTIALDSFTLAVLKEHRTRVEMWAAQAAVALDQDGYVLTFDPSATAPMKPDSFGQAFRRLCRAAGIEGVSLHTLRHFSASVLVASGWDVRTVAGRLGHSDATTTLRVYSHMVEGRDRDAADFLGELLSDGKTVAFNKADQFTR